MHVHTTLVQHPFATWSAECVTNLAYLALTESFVQGSNTSDVSGQVVRWSHDNGVAKLDASQYIEMLEREVEILRQELDDSNEVWPHREPVFATVIEL